VLFTGVVGAEVLAFVGVLRLVDARFLVVLLLFAVVVDTAEFVLESVGVERTLCALLLIGDGVVEAGPALGREACEERRL
jgi:hypothetical protein